MADVSQQALTTGFGCFYEGYSKWRHSVWHDSAHLQQFELAVYEGDEATREANAHAHRTTFNNDQFTATRRPLGRWLSQSGILRDDELSTLRSEPLWPVCFGGNFAVRAANVRRVRHKGWLSLQTTLQRGDNIEEGHYAERLWAALLAPTLPTEEACDVACAAVEVVSNGSHPLAGKLMGCACD